MLGAPIEPPPWPPRPRSPSSIGSSRSPRIWSTGRSCTSGRSTQHLTARFLFGCCASSPSWAWRLHCGSDPNILHLTPFGPLLWTFAVYSLADAVPLLHPGPSLLLGVFVDPASLALHPRSRSSTAPSGPGSTSASPVSATNSSASPRRRSPTPTRRRTSRPPWRGCHHARAALAPLVTRCKRPHRHP